jgi:hypothetical protein
VRAAGRHRRVQAPGRGLEALAARAPRRRPAHRLADVRPLRRHRRGGRRRVRRPGDDRAGGPRRPGRRPGPHPGHRHRGRRPRADRPPAGRLRRDQPLGRHPHRLPGGRGLHRPGQHQAGRDRRARHAGRDAGRGRLVRHRPELRRRRPPHAAVPGRPSAAARPPSPRSPPTSASGSTGCCAPWTSARCPSRRRPPCSRPCRAPVAPTASRPATTTTPAPPGTRC